MVMTIYSPPSPGRAVDHYNNGKLILHQIGQLCRTSKILQNSKIHADDKMEFADSEWLEGIMRKADDAICKHFLPFP